MGNRRNVHIIWDWLKIAYHQIPCLWNKNCPLRLPFATWGVSDWKPHFGLKHIVMMACQISYARRCPPVKNSLMTLINFRYIYLYTISHNEIGVMFSKLASPNWGTTLNQRLRCPAKSASCFIGNCLVDYNNLQLIGLHEPLLQALQASSNI